MRLLVVNAGSSSLKFDLLETTSNGPPKRLLSGAFVDAANGSGQFIARIPGTMGAAQVQVGSLPEAALFVLGWLADPAAHGRNLIADLAATIHRIVHGGERFRTTTTLDEAALAALADLAPLAPLHNPPALAVITAVRQKLGPTVPVIGVFDTAYYADLPEAAFRYAVPRRWYADFGIRRYGFHGTAHRYMCQAVRARLQGSRPTARIVSLQLGRGCSATATFGERAIATSMGFTPLEGLVMGTRCGDIDPGALLFMMERTGMTPGEMRGELNEASGLLGLSERTADVRELLALERDGSPAAALALEIFCRRARHFIAAYIAELGGVDVIACGGGIGENSPEIRRRILAGMEWAGAVIDQDLNAASVGTNASIAAARSRIAVEVVLVDEASVIAAEGERLLAHGANRPVV